MLKTFSRFQPPLESNLSCRSKMSFLRWLGQSFVFFLIPPQHMSQLMQPCVGTTSWLRLAIRPTRSRMAVTLTCSLRAWAWVMTGICSIKGYKRVWPRYPSFGHFSKEFIYQIINYSLVTCFSYPPPRWDFFENIFGPRRRYDIFVPQKSWDQLKFQGKHGHTQQG